MTNKIQHSVFVYISIVAVSVLLLPACDRGNDRITGVTDVRNSPPPVETERTSAIEIPEIETGIKQYIFDVNGHTIAELQGLLNRADEINESQRDEFRELDIILVLHGPDINIFTYQNYSQNKQLIDLAARLDAFGIIDIKICETSMSELGISRDEFPPFIEPVPYAKKTIEEFTDRGYIKL